MTDTWFAVFESGTSPSTSDPVSTGTVIDADDLQRQGRTYITLSSDPRGLVWNQSTQVFVEPPPPPPRPRISLTEFFRRFTAQQYFDWTQSKSPDVVHFLAQVSAGSTVNLESGPVKAGLLMLKTAGILTAEDVTKIGTP